MNTQLQITFRNVKASEAIEDYIRSKAAKLDMLYTRLMGCRVAVEIPHRHHQQGSLYHIRIDLIVPGGEIVVKHEPSSNAWARHASERAIRKSSEVNLVHKDLWLAINDAFKVAGRRLQDYARRQRGDIKNPATFPEARVSKILPAEGYGFLTSDDGREIYFHENSVLGGGFQRLKIGTMVRFAEEPGEKGPQASSVHIVPKQGARKVA
ncbi:MAG TPA: HPF/RaiA family ribosome-associated protein [Candidatus Acidoferrum sp.]|nr:HPF/RaiA family ribosome-associated protein [Candidatus Acidoferrum sp.]